MEASPSGNPIPDGGLAWQRMINTSEPSVSHRTLAALLELASDGIFTVSYPDSRITYWNAGASVMYGWSPDEAVGQQPGDLLHSDLGRPRQEVVDEVVRTGRWAGRIVQRDRTGRRMIVDARWALQTDAAGSPIGIFEVNRDITVELAAIERDLEKAALLEQASDAIFTLSLPDSRITYWNTGAARLYGWSAAEAIGRTPLELLHTRSAQSREQIIDEVIREGHWSGLLDQRHRDGTRLIVEGRWALQRDEAGRPIAVLEFNRDLTAERAAEVAKGRAINVISHELRTPLAVVKGYASLFLDGSLGPPPAAWERSLATMYEKILQLESLVERVIASAELNTVVDLQPVDLWTAIEEALVRASAIHPSAGTSISVERSPAVLALADSRLVGTILDNLIDNAITYSSSPPTVRIWIEPDPMPQILVEDRGVGIAATDQTGLFGAFVRLNLERFADQPGPGLGLYMSRRLARIMGGDVTLDRSAVGKGSVFKLTLPHAPSP